MFKSLNVVKVALLTMIPKIVAPSFTFFAFQKRFPFQTLLVSVYNLMF